MDILFVAAECSPFIKTGGLADVIGSLPNTLIKYNVKCSVVLPYYKKIKIKNDCEYIGYTFFNFNNENKYVGVFKKIENNVTYYFLDNDEYFNFNQIYGLSNDDQRFTFFNIAVLETLHFFGNINIIHANDWHTGLIPYFIKYKYNLNIKTVFTIHNIQYQGIFNKDICKYIGSYNDTLEFDNKINFMKCAIINSDIITTVSPTYRNETFNWEYSYNLENILNLRRNDYYGILNGIDTSLFNPQTDKFIYKNYNIHSFEDKYINKYNFCCEYNLNNNLLCGLVSRLANQKGIELILDSLDELINNTNMNFFLMGSGDLQYENLLNYYSNKYPNRVRVFIGYDESIAQKVYASSDILLIPSKFEPCGLSQMIAMRYGTLPLVRETGGLKDTVIPFNYEHTGCGFSFKNFSSNDLKCVLYLANNIYFDKFHWNNLIRNAMNKNYSFDTSTKEYIEIYKKLRG